MMSKISNKNDKENEISLFNFVTYTLVTCVGMIFGLRAAIYRSLLVQNFQKEIFRWGILAGIALFMFSLMVWTYAEKDKQVDSFGDIYYDGSDDE